MSDSFSIIVVGGGQAASSAIAKLREKNASCSITLISDEPVLPYQRPPLSKAYLSGEMPRDRLIFREQDWFDENRIEVRLGERVESIDRQGQNICLYNGDVLSYDRLLLTTGSAPRRLPHTMGGALDNVFYLRDTRDADLMRPHMQVGKKLVVVGGGYIGLEVAAIARKAGLDVTLVEMGERILQRVAAPETSRFYRDLHEGHGVTVLEGTGLECLHGQSGAVTHAELSDGSMLDADLVLVGIGVVPRSELAELAGIKVENGIAVDETARTSDAYIWAAGDCASFPHGGKRIRLESVPHAIAQGECAALNMLGEAMQYKAKPWFWSDQYDVKLQIAGLNTGYDNVVVRPGRREGAQSIWYYCGDRLVAVDAMNDAPSFMMARRVLEAGNSIPKHIAADAAANLKEWA